MKKIVSILFALALVALTVTPITVNAASVTGSYGPAWTKTSNGDWTYQDGSGTSLVARIDDNTLYIKGTGAVPSYSRDCIGNRPWNGRYITDLVIENGITSIGEEAFSNLNYLYNVTMPVSAFVVSPSAFGGEREECIFRITGTNIVTKADTGVVPYTSLDSIVDMMLVHQYDYSFILDNYYMVGLAKNSAGGEINNLSASDGLTQSYNPNYPLYDLTSTGMVVNANGNDISGVNVKNKRQGEIVNEIFSLVIGDMNYATAYNITAYNSKGVIQNTTTPVQYRITIPPVYRNAGRQFSLIQIGTGEVNILADEDTDDTTVTFTTTYGNTAYALCYKDVQ
jgi:hypothetical protein